MMNRDEIVREMRAAAEEVFNTMLNTPLTFVNSCFDKSPTKPLDGVVCLIGMAGRWTATGTVSCSAETACRLASQMLMTQYTVVDAEVLDAVAEIANMVLGNVKTALERSLGAMGMSIPTAIFGKNFLAKSFGDETWNVVIYESEGQQIEIKLFVRPSPVAAVPGAMHACTPVYLPD